MESYLRDLILSISFWANHNYSCGVIRLAQNTLTKRMICGQSNTLPVGRVRKRIIGNANAELENGSSFVSVHAYFLQKKIAPKNGQQVPLSAAESLSESATLNLRLASAPGPTPRSSVPSPALHLANEGLTTNLMLRLYVGLTEPWGRFLHISALTIKLTTSVSCRITAIFGKSAWQRRTARFGAYRLLYEVSKILAILFASLGHQCFVDWTDQVCG